MSYGLDPLCLPTSSGFTRDRTMQNLYGARYIDDILMHREDHDGDGDFTDIGSERWWHLTDVQFSTVAIIDDAAVIAERIQYDAYGRAYHHQSNDTDGDGDYDSTDRGVVQSLAGFGAQGAPIESGVYEPDADIDRDGDVDFNDVTLIGTNYTSALSRGELSNATVKNTIGWDGYVFNAEDESYYVRLRVYLPQLGRWTLRDPGGYHDDTNLYSYTIANPLSYVDPFGLRRDGRISGGRPYNGNDHTHETSRPIYKYVNGQAILIGEVRHYYDDSEYLGYQIEYYNNPPSRSGDQAWVDGIAAAGGCCKAQCGIGDGETAAAIQGTKAFAGSVAESVIGEAAEEGVARAAFVVIGGPAGAAGVAIYAIYKIFDRSGNVVKVIKGGEDALEEALKHARELARGTSEAVRQAHDRASDLHQNVVCGFRFVNRRAVAIHNDEALEWLQKIKPGKWEKVYDNGYDSCGSEVSIHYWRHQSGTVIEGEHYPRWSK